MAVDLLVQSSPFITGIALDVAFLIGLFILRTPLELAVLVLVPFNVIIVAFYIPAITPIIAIGCGLLIGFMFLRIVRR